MIRWDPAGDHIIVERPEQLALHVLPSVYRQSRFASFSRQLNARLFFSFINYYISRNLQIYGFMRKVNLRNVDPAIDDPDASTWCMSFSFSRARLFRRPPSFFKQHTPPSTATRPPRSSQTSSAASRRASPSHAKDQTRTSRTSRPRDPPLASALSPSPCRPPRPRLWACPAEWAWVSV